MQLTSARRAASACARVPRGAARRVLVVSQEGCFNLSEDPCLEVVLEALRRRGHVIAGTERWDSFAVAGATARALANADVVVVLAASGGNPDAPFVTRDDDAGAALRDWVASGGSFVVIQAEDRSHSFHRLFDKPWTYKWYRRIDHTLNTGASSASIFAPPACTTTMSVKAVLLDSVPTHEAIYSGVFDGSVVATAVACGAFGKGTVVSAGDVNMEEETLRVLCALAGAARPSTGPQHAAATQEPNSCSTCGAPPAFTCARCRSERYCAKACQAHDWKAGHKAACTAASTA